MSIGGLEFTASLFLLWALVFLCWRSYRVDRLRDQLFGLRNELFDITAQGALSFDDPAYQMLRNTMNGLIRGAEHISFFRYMVVSIGEDASEYSIATENFRRWTSAIENLSEPQRKVVLGINEKLNDIMIGNLLLGSPLLWILIPLGLIAVLIPHISARIRGALVKTANVIEAAALAEQELAVQPV